MTPGVPTIVVHGGAGRIPGRTDGKPGPEPEYAQQARAGLAEALAVAGAGLSAGGSALEAVVAAVRELERCEAFNAGRGCSLDAEGGVGLDAAVMEGAERRAGGVIGVGRIEHPVDAALAVLRDGRHVLLVGSGAERFAESAGLALVEPGHHVTERRRTQHARAARPPAPGGERPGGGTVGAVALDAAGHLAAATSTGGLAARLPGRVADSGLVGSGTWADDATAAVSATGLGEFFVRQVFAYDVDARMRYGGRSLAEACAQALAGVGERGGGGGCIALDAGGRVAMPFDTPDMPRGLRVGDGPARIALQGRDEPG